MLYGFTSPSVWLQQPLPLPQVYRGTYKQRAVAVKLYGGGRTEQGPAALVQQYHDLRAELTVMSHLQHPRVVSPVGVALQPLCMVLPLAPQGSLSDHLQLCPQGFDPPMAHRLLFQVSRCERKVRCSQLLTSAPRLLMASATCTPSTSSTVT